MIVWITGASSGLGFYTALALKEAGHTVIVGARSLYQSKEAGIYHLPLDVTEESSIQAFTSAALEIAPRVDVLIHCAAILTFGGCEETSPEEYARVMNTNFLGMVRMNQAVLPLMRAQGSGRIVMLSSINGLMGVPFQSAYTAAKHAVEGYAECLQLEVRRFGIEVCLVEPGDHRGGSQRCRGRAEKAGEIAAYESAYAYAVAVIRRDEAKGSNPIGFGRKIAKLLARKRLPFRVCIASVGQHGAVQLHRLLPYRWLEPAVGWYYEGKDGRKKRQKSGTEE